MSERKAWLYLILLSFAVLGSWISLIATISHYYQLAKKYNFMVPVPQGITFIGGRRIRKIKFYPLCCRYNHQPAKWMSFKDFLKDSDIIGSFVLLIIFTLIVIWYWKIAISQIIQNLRKIHRGM